MGSLCVIDAETDKVIQESDLCSVGSLTKGIAVQPFWWFARE